MFDVMEDEKLCSRRDEKKMKRDEKRKNKKRQEKLSCNPRGGRTRDLIPRAGVWPNRGSTNLISFYSIIDINIYSST